MSIFPKISLDDNYILIKTLGEGSYGKVYLAQVQNTNDVVVLKELKKSTPKVIEDLTREVENLRELSYKPCYSTISCYRDSFIDTKTGRYYLVLDFYDGDDLDVLAKILKKYVNQETYETIMLNLLTIILKALEYVHNKGIVHGDIKATNIIVVKSYKVTPVETKTELTTAYQPIILDFGLSCNMLDKSCLKIAGTLYYLAPECCKRLLKKSTLEGRSPKSDIWSLGLTFYQLVVDANIWPDIESDIEFVEYIISQTRTFNANTSNQTLNALLNNMLIYDPSERPSASELLSYIS